MLAKTVITAQVKTTLSETQSDQNVAEQDFAETYTTVPAGLDLLYNARISFTGAGATALDLSGSLLDALGAATIYATVHTIIVTNLATVSGDFVQIGGNANEIPLFGAVADFIKVGPGGVLLLSDPTDGIAVTAGTGDILTVENTTASTFDVDIAILGKA